MSHASTFQPAAAPGREPATHTGVLLRKCSCGGSCAKCREADEESLHRKAAGTPAGHEAPSIVHDVIASSGQALDAVTQSDMERRFAHDFSRVRIHTDARAAASAQAVQAHAYTVGQHVVFGAGRFAPTTHEGRHLLAHELAHTVQQENAGERRQHRLIVRDSDSADERAADRAADIAVRGGAHARPPLVTGHSTPGRALQRKGSGLLPPQKVHDVYLKWIEVYFKSRGTNVLTDALEKEIRERVKQQVGPGNFANYERWEQEEADKHWAKGQAENKPKPQPTDLRSAQFERYDEMWNATKTLRAEIVRVEHLAQKVNFGKGAKGTVARATAGGYTAMYGVGARTVTSVAEHAPMFVLGGAGVMLGSEMAEDFVVKQGQAVKQEGEEMGADARTAVRLVGGELQANFEATRPAKKKYDDAFSAFSDHSSNFKNPKGETNFEIDMARSADLAGMEAAMKEMRTAGNEFLSICARMGIETDANALDVMGKNIMKGAEGAIETAVTGVVPEVAPSLRQIKSAVKGAKKLEKPLEKEAKEQLAKQVLKGADDVPVTGAGKPPAAGKGPAKGKPDAPAAPDDVVLAKEPGAGGHDIEVTPHGVEICSPQPCPVLEVAYAKELKQAPELAPELKEINQLRKTDPKKAAEKAAALQRKLEGVRTKTAAQKAKPRASDVDAPPSGEKGSAPEKGPEAKSRRELKEEQAASTAKAKEQATRQIQDKEDLLDQIFKENADLTQRGKTRLSESARKELDLEKAANAREANQVIDDLEQLRKQREALEITPLGRARAYSHSGAADKAVRSRARNLDEISGTAIKNASVDHVVPIDEIVLMDGWTKLLPDDQRAILSRVNNLRLMEKAINSSKGARRWVNWPQGRYYYGAKKWQEMVDLEGQLRQEIQGEIARLAALRTK